MLNVWKKKLKANLFLDYLHPKKKKNSDKKQKVNTFCLFPNTPDTGISDLL